MSGRTAEEPGGGRERARPPAYSTHRHAREGGPSRISALLRVSSSTSHRCAPSTCASPSSGSSRSRRRAGPVMSPWPKRESLDAAEGERLARHRHAHVHAHHARPGVVHHVLGHRAVGGEDRGRVAVRRGVLAAPAPPTAWAPARWRSSARTAPSAPHSISGRTWSMMVGPSQLPPAHAAPEGFLPRPSSSTLAPSDCGPGDGRLQPLLRRRGR